MTQRIGIYSPYTWDEATYCACGLADYCAAKGADVSFYVPDGPRHGVHDRWDAVAGRNEHHYSFRNWAKACSHIVFFTVPPAKLRQLNSHRGKRILVFLPNKLQESQRGNLTMFTDVVVCLPAANVLTLADGDFPTIHHIPWFYRKYTGSSRPGLVLSPQRWFVWCDGYTTKQFGCDLLYLLGSLLQRQPGLRITVCFDRNLTAPGQVFIRQLHRDMPASFVCQHRVSAAQRLAGIDDANIVLIPSLRSGSGVVVAEALSCGKPVLAFPVSPIREMLLSLQQRYMLPGSTTILINGDQRFDPSLSDTRTMLQRLCDFGRSPRSFSLPLTLIQQQCEYFRTGWDRLFNWT